MTHPFFSCVCVTYGRVAHLQEAIACFLNQDYPGVKELIVLNTFKKQVLEGDFPNVRIVNLPGRPSSLGQARNLANSMARGTHIVTWDDDDLYLPHHLTTFAKYYEGNRWVMLNRMFYATQWQIRSTARGGMNLFSYERSVWEEVGRFAPMNCGEDRNFAGRITGAYKGEIVRIQPEEISFIYSWGNGAYHVSGLGDDEKGKPTGHERIEQFTEDLVRRKKIQIGRIELKPELKADYATNAREFLNLASLSGEAEREICVVMLGRYGDIINILPILLHIHNTFAKPYLMVSRQFMDMLDGISYVHAYPFDGKNNHLNEAIAEARARFKNVLIAQIWGDNWAQEQKCESYNWESWRMAGFGHKFLSTDSQWKPHFDKADGERAELARRKIDNGKKMIVCNLKRSISSPTPEGEKLYAELTAKLSDDFNVVDVSDLKLDRIYDLLAIVRGATCVLSIDTSLIHLTAATSTPLIAFTNPRKWLGSMPRALCHARFTYDEIESNTARIIEHVREISKTSTPPNILTLPKLLKAPDRTLYHATERHDDGDPKEGKRKLKAHLSWDALYERGIVPAHLWNYPRYATEIGDPRPLPYLKDILEHAINQAGDDDIIMLTNDDTYLRPELPDLLKFHVAVYGACSSFRCDFREKIPSDNVPIPNLVKQSLFHMGRDLFAFTKEWLTNYWPEIPDFIAGASEWDLCLAAMIRIKMGFISDRNTLAAPIYPAEIERGYVCHLAHEPYWSKATNVSTAPSQVHNRKLFRKWAERFLPSLKFYPGDVI